MKKIFLTAIMFGLLAAHPAFALGDNGLDGFNNPPPVCTTLLTLDGPVTVCR